MSELDKAVHAKRIRDTQEHVDLLKSLAIAYARSGYSPMETTTRAIRVAGEIMHEVGVIRGRV